MGKVAPRICRAPLLEELYCLIHMAQQEMALTQCRIKACHPRVAWTEPNCLLYVRDSRPWLAQQHHRYPKVRNRVRAIAVERHRRLELEPRFGQSVLDSTKVAHRRPRR